MLIETLGEQMDNLHERMKKIDQKLDRIYKVNQDLKIEVKVLEEYIL